MKNILLLLRDQLRIVYMITGRIRERKKREETEREVKILKTKIAKGGEAGKRSGMGEGRYES